MVLPIRIELVFELLGVAIRLIILIMEAQNKKSVGVIQIIHHLSMLSNQIIDGCFISGWFIRLIGKHTVCTHIDYGQICILKFTAPYE